MCVCVLDGYFFFPQSMFCSQNSPDENADIDMISFVRALSLIGGFIKMHGRVKWKKHCQLERTFICGLRVYHSIWFCPTRFLSWKEMASSWGWSRLSENCSDPRNLNDDIRGSPLSAGLARWWSHHLGALAIMWVQVTRHAQSWLCFEAKAKTFLASKGQSPKQSNTFWTKVRYESMWNLPNICIVGFNFQKPLGLPHFPDQILWYVHSIAHEEKGSRAPALTTCYLHQRWCHRHPPPHHWSHPHTDSHPNPRRPLARLHSLLHSSYQSDLRAGQPQVQS